MPRIAGLIVALMFAAAVPAGAQTPAETGQMRLRIQELENQNRQLLGQVETLSHQVRMLQDQLAGGSPAAAQTTVRPYEPAQQLQPQLQPPMQGLAASPTGTPGGPVPQAQVEAAGPGAPPQTLGQIPGRPLDLNALTQAGQAIAEHGQPFSGRIASAPTDSPKDAYDLSYGFILRADYPSAQAGFSDFLQRFPDDPLAGNARYWLGEAYFMQGQFREAAENFLKAYTDHKGGAKAPDSLLKLGMSLVQRQQKDAACSTFRQLGQEYPNASRTILETMQAEASRAGC